MISKNIYIPTLLILLLFQGCISSQECRKDDLEKTHNKKFFFNSAAIFPLTPKFKKYKNTKYAFESVPIIKIKNYLEKKYSILLNIDEFKSFKLGDKRNLNESKAKGYASRIGGIFWIGKDNKNTVQLSVQFIYDKDPGIYYTLIITRKTEGNQKIVLSDRCIGPIIEEPEEFFNYLENRVFNIENRSDCKCNCKYDKK